jgi:DNA invertase Pin-like site-specific DNA recombinase
MTKRVIELIRVSTEGQAAADRASIPAQRTVNRRTAEVYGLEIVRTLEMSDVSGAAVLLAPEMRQMLEWMRSPDLHGVVTKEFSRLMRPENFGDYTLLQHFADTKTLLYLPEGPIDLSSKMGRLMGGVRALFAGVEREEIRERVWLAKEEKRRRGEHPQGAISLPYGVGWERGRGWFYEPEAERVRAAYRLLLSGETSYSEISKQVGIDRYNLRVILKNPIYTGWRVIDTKRDSSAAGLRVKPNGRQADRPKVKRRPDEVIRLNVIQDGLISEQDFDRAQQIMAAKRTKHWRSQPSYSSPYAYHGHLSCAACGELVYTYSNSRGGNYYVCKAKQYPRVAGHKCLTPYMRRGDLEPKLDRLFGKRLSDAVFLRELTQECERRTQNEDSAASLVRIQQEIENLRAKKERILEAFFDGVISVTERDKRLADIGRDLEVNRELMSRQAPSVALTADVLEQLCCVFYEWEFLNVGQKRQILACTVPDIRVANGQIHGITVNLPLSRQCEVTRKDKDSWRPPA